MNFFDFLDKRMSDPDCFLIVLFVGTAAVYTVTQVMYYIAVMVRGWPGTDEADEDLPQ